MKPTSLLSGLVVACIIGPFAQAAEITKNAVGNSSVVVWSDVTSSSWKLPDAPASTTIKIREVGIFPALAAASTVSAASLAEESAAKALMAPASVLASNKDFGVDSFLAYVNLPQASYSFPGQTGTASAIRDKTELAGKFEAAESIAEPASEVLMLGALAALAIAVRRRMPNERF